jgi:hypothetical protein
MRNSLGTNKGIKMSEHPLKASRSKRTWLARAAVILAAWLLMGCQSATPEEAGRFGFSLSFGACTTDQVNAFQGSYTRQVDNQRSVTITFAFTEKELASIRALANEIDIYGYPERFAVPVAPGEKQVVVTPATTYQLSVEDGDRQVTVLWVDEIVQPTHPQADALRRLIQAILQVVQASPAVRVLPDPAILCD